MKQLVPGSLLAAVALFSWGAGFEAPRAFAETANRVAGRFDDSSDSLKLLTVTPKSWPATACDAILFGDSLKTVTGKLRNSLRTDPV